MGRGHGRLRAPMQAEIRQPCAARQHLGDEGGERTDGFSGRACPMLLHGDQRP